MAVSSSLSCRYRYLFQDTTGTYGVHKEDFDSSQRSRRNNETQEVYLRYESPRLFGLCHQTGRLEVANHAAEAIRKLKVPTTGFEPRSLLRLYNVFRRFVPNFARIASPYSEHLKKTKRSNLDLVMGKS